LCHWNRVIIAFDWHGIILAHRTSLQSSLIMTGWQFPTKEQWLQAWQSAHAVYSEQMDPDDATLCQALLWHARAACQQNNEQS
jgi:hypothetical protein